MILGVNGIRLTGNVSGVARAIEAVLWCMGDVEHPFTEIRVYTPSPVDKAIKLPPHVRNIVVSSLLPPGLWEQLTLLRAHGSKNLLFCPSYVAPLFVRSPTLLVHHGSYEGYSDAAKVFSRWARTKARVMYELSARRATVVSTVSQFSKMEMARFYRISPDKIHVVPEGVDTRLFRPLTEDSRLSEWRRRTLGTDVPFILYVGKPTRRRNLPNLFRAFRRIKRDTGWPHKLLLIGTSLPGTSFSDETRDLGISQDVVNIGHVNHEELVLAYNACAAMVYPSSYEGFGMPVLEAMACGAPVVALDNTALPEFAAGVARLLPDAGVDTLANGIREVIVDEGLRHKMAVEGPNRAADYDWRKVTRRYVELMRRALDMD